MYHKPRSVFPVVIALIGGIALGIIMARIIPHSPSHAEVHLASFKKCIAEISHSSVTHVAIPITDHDKLLNAVEVLGAEADCVTRAGIGGLSVSELQRMAGTPFANPPPPPKAVR